MGTKLVPELIVTDYHASLAFYTGLIGFQVHYDRPEFGFAYLDLGGAHLMIEEYRDGPRDWRTASLEPPFGRGIHLQIEIDNVEALHQRVLAKPWPIFWPMEERYEVGNRQFLLQDPDGYLLRFFSDLGERPRA